MLHHTVLLVSAIIAAYNKYMYAVDRMDQIQSTAPTHHFEKDLPMTLLTLILDLAMNNSGAVKQKLKLEMAMEN